MISRKRYCCSVVFGALSHYTHYQIFLDSSTECGASHKKDRTAQQAGGEESREERNSRAAVT